MSSKQFTQKQKLVIVKSAAKIGIKKASVVAGVRDNRKSNTAAQ